MLTDDVVVAPGATLILSGIINGDLIVYNQGRAEVTGIVNKSAKGNGVIDLYGIINSTVESSLTINVNRGAYINGYRYPQNTVI